MMLSYDKISHPTILSFPIIDVYDIWVPALMDSCAYDVR